MKTLLSILAIAAIGALCGTGASVSSTPDTVDGFVVLNDTELSQRTGGADTSVIDTWWEGYLASCSLVDCSPVIYYYYPDIYKCVPCNDYNESAYQDIEVDWKIKTSCYMTTLNGDPICKVLREVLDTKDSCDDYLGACGSGSGG